MLTRMSERRTVLAAPSKINFEKRSPKADVTSSAAESEKLCPPYSLDGLALISGSDQHIF